jgi:hypothetical protein
VASWRSREKVEARKQLMLCSRYVAFDKQKRLKTQLENSSMKTANILLRTRIFIFNNYIVINTIIQNPSNISEKYRQIWWIYPKNIAKFGGYIRKILLNLVGVSEKYCRIWWIYPKNIAEFGGYIRKILPNLVDISEKYC